MKPNKDKSTYVEVVVPFGNGKWEAALDGLFDDCPICQQLRKDIAEGKVERIVPQKPEDE